MKRFSRSARVGFVAAMGGLAALACAPTPSGGPAAPPSGQQPPAAAQPAGPKPGGIARFGTIGAPPNLHAYVAVSGAGLLTTSGTLYEPFVDFDYTVKDYRADFPLDLKMAESWSQPDPTTYLFKLRQGVLFHDGKPMTVEDAVWSMEYFRDPKNGFEGAGRLNSVDRVEKADATSLRMILKAPNPTFLIDIAGGTSQPAVILPKHVFDEGGADALNSKGIGTGAFKLVKFDPSGTTVMARHEGYWRKDAQGRPYPYINGAEFIHNMDRSTNEAAFAAGEVDLVHFQTKDQHDALKKLYKDFDTQIHHTGHGTGVYFNASRPPFSDIRARKAVHLALDRHELNETVLGGAGKLSGPVVPGIKEGWGYSADELLKLPGFRQDKAEDMKEAKRLLAEAGHADGLKVVYINDRTWGSAPMADYIPTTLKRAGIEVQQRAAETASHDKDLRDGNYDIAWRHMANEKPLVRLPAFFESKGVFSKAAGISDPEMDRLIDQLRSAGAMEEQKRLVRRLAEMQVEKVYAANVGDPALFRGEQKWFKGYQSFFTAQAAPGASLWYLWLDQDQMPAKRKR